MNPSEATREIYWNLPHLGNKLAMYLMLFFALAIAGNAAFCRFRAVTAGSRKSLNREFRTLSFLLNIYRYAITQRRTVSSPDGAVWHTLIYLGFIVLLVATTSVFIDYDLGIPIYQGNYYLIITFLSDLFGLLFGLGVLVAIYRRMIEKPDKLHSSIGDHAFLMLLLLLIVQGFLLEALRIAVTDDIWQNYSFVGGALAQVFWAFSESSLRSIHFVTWWFHTATVFAIIAFAPYSKFTHLIASSINLGISPKRPKGDLNFDGDIMERLEKEDLDFGLNSLKDYSWDQLLNLEACTSCGRCQEVCPAYASGAPLSPKWLILDTKHHHHANLAQEGLDGFLIKNIALKQSGVVADDSGRYSYNLESRSGNLKVNGSVSTLGGGMERPITEVIDPDVFWACTTCYACVNVCPVNINHVDQIVGHRRHLTMLEGSIPREAATMLSKLESRNNPLGSPENERQAWTEGLDVRILQEGDEVDYLYWVGCISSYDKRKAEIARSMVKIMNKAGVSFGVLGNKECCTGDPARRLGQEMTFQTLRNENENTFKGVKYKTIVCNCPHCFNSLKNEYSNLGNVVHHTKMVKEFLDKGLIEVGDFTAENATFHDPCYLGRYNDEYDAPREIISKTSNLVEMPRSRDKGMCCGAGGGHYWADLKLGDERINKIRAEEAVETGASQIVTGCPFCMQMMEDGLKMIDSEVVVKDVAELVAEKLR